MSVTYSGDGITFNDGSSISSGYTGFKNRIRNGAMLIDQRGSSSSAISSSSFAYSYGADGYMLANSHDGVTTVQQVSDAPTGSGFTKSLKVTVTTADASLGASQRCVMNQGLEGQNMADLMWGTAYAKPVTLSFWVKSSVTGTYSVGFRTGSAGTNYISSYTINSSNTWEQKTITIPGATIGTWVTDNNTWAYLMWNLGIGSDYNVSTLNSWVSATNGQGSTSHTSLMSTLNATWQITGVQLEAGSTATSFDWRPYSTELVICQRYFYKPTQSASLPYISTGFNTGTTEAVGLYKLPVAMRIAPSMTFSGTYQDVTTLKTGTTLSYASDGVTETSVLLIYQSFTGLTSQGPNFIRGSTANSYPSFSAEL